LSDKIRNKAILTGYGRDRSQESFQRVPKKSMVSKIRNYHFFTTFLPLWFSANKSRSEYPRRFWFEAVCLKNKEEQLSLEQLFQKIII